MNKATALINQLIFPLSKSWVSLIGVVALSMMACVEEPVVFKVGELQAAKLVSFQNDGVEVGYITKDCEIHAITITVAEFNGILREELANGSAELQCRKSDGSLTTLLLIPSVIPN